MTTDALPENLTHCCDCGSEFSEPAANWDEFFSHIEDASFWCASCEEANTEKHPA